MFHPCAKISRRSFVMLRTTLLSAEIKVSPLFIDSCINMTELPEEKDILAQLQPGHNCQIPEILS